MAPFISRPAGQRPSQDDRRQARWHNHIPRPGARSLSKMGLSALLWRSRQNERVCASFFLTPLLVKVDGRHHWETALCDVFPPACSGLCLSFLWSVWKASRTDHGWRWCNPPCSSRSAPHKGRDKSFDGTRWLGKCPEACADKDRRKEGMGYHLTIKSPELPLLL